LSSTRNENMQINQNILSSYEFDSQFIARFETPYSESSINYFSSKSELKCLRDPIDSRVTLVSILNSVYFNNIIIKFTNLLLINFIN